MGAWGRRQLVIMGVALAALLVGAVAQAQFGRGFRGARLASDNDFDRRFQYCRLFYRGAGFGGGGGWQTDYPMAEQNLSVRLGELTRLNVSKVAGRPNPVIVGIGTDQMFQCPFIIMSAPGSSFFSDSDAASLREYLLKGGMLWTDDSWGSFQWSNWTAQIGKVLPPSEYPIVDIPLTHGLFNAQFEITEIPQIPNIGFWLRSGHQTSEQGADSATPYVKGILDKKGNIMVMSTHNTDIADSWEREGEDVGYFYAMSPRGYAFAVNAVLYAHTH